MPFIYWYERYDYQYEDQAEIFFKSHHIKYSLLLSATNIK